MNRKPMIAALGALAAGALTLTACSGGGASNENAATGEPIPVAAVASLSLFPEASEAAKAYFDAYNAAGGLDGRPIELTVFDDKADPATSVTVANDVVTSDAVALVGSASLLDCAVNAATWQENGIVSFMGAGTDPFCFDVPSIAAANSGAFLGTMASLTYGSEELGFENVCAVIVKDDALSEKIFNDLFAAWEQATGSKLAYLDNSLTRGQASYASNVSQLKQQNCDALFVNEVADAVLGLLGEATNQGVDLPVLALTSVYSDQFAAAAASYGGEIYAPAEFVPYSSDDAANADWAAVMEQAGVTKTAFAQGGYAMAEAFVQVLESIEGDITRDSFTAAARGMSEPLSAPMLGGSWIFGPGEAHHPNQNVWPVVLKPGTSTWESLGVKMTADEIGWVPLELPKPE